MTIIDSETDDKAHLDETASAIFISTRNLLSRYLPEAEVFKAWDDLSEITLEKTNDRGRT